MSSSSSATPIQTANKMPSTATTTTFTDEQLDRDWQPSGRRPQSTIARSFSQELMDIFRIENSVADLDAKLDERKQFVQTRASELEAIEARIKEMEDRLKRNGQAPAPQTAMAQRAPQPAVAQEQNADQKHGGGSRPGTAKASAQAVPGALPPTPTASEGEYEFIPDPYSTSFGPDYPRFRHQNLVPRLTAVTESGGGPVAAGILHQAQQLRQHYSINSPGGNLLHNVNKNFSFQPHPQSQPDARSIKSVRTIGSENGSADFELVTGPDGDGEPSH